PPSSRGTRRATGARSATTTAPPTSGRSARAPESSAATRRAAASSGSSPRPTAPPPPSSSRTNTEPEASPTMIGFHYLDAGTLLLTVEDEHDQAVLLDLAQAMGLRTGPTGATLPPLAAPRWPATRSTSPPPSTPTPSPAGRRSRSASTSGASRSSPAPSHAEPPSHARTAPALRDRRRARSP